MKVYQRHCQILARARTDGRVEVGVLASDLQVAEETVRRDLRELVGVASCHSVRVVRDQASPTMKACQATGIA